MLNPYIAICIAGTSLVTAVTVSATILSRDGYTDFEFSFFGCKFKGKK